MILKEKIGEDLPISNVSDPKDKKLCENFINSNKNRNFKYIIYYTYKDDFNFFPIE